jgi:hypothetical protein
VLSLEEIDSFVEAYIISGDATIASKEVHPEFTPKQAHIYGSNMMRMEDVRRRTIMIKKETASKISLDDYIAKLEQIRDDALDNGKYAPALQAHVVIGKLAGHFDKPDQLGGAGEAATLSNEELLKRISALDNSGPRLIEVVEHRMLNE